MQSAEKALDRRRQYAAYAALSLAVFVVTASILPSSEADFQRFLGNVDPLLVVVASSLAGAAALALLYATYGFEILKGRATLRGIGVSAMLATLLGVAIIVADLLLGYPEGINVPMPQALLFYPAIGFVAEILFHVVPLALVLLVLTPFRKRLGSDRTVWLGIFLVAALEPIFQVTFEDAPFSGIARYTLGHVFIIALLQLMVFRRYDFVSMYAFRLFYYAYWHIIWGVIRLKVLF